MKKIFFFLVIPASLVLSCNNCVECKGTKYCDEPGSTYTDANGNSVSWSEYSATIVANCQ